MIGFVHGVKLLDAGRQGADLGGQGIDLIQQHPREFGVMVVEPAIEGGEQSRVFGLHPAPRQLGQRLGSRCPAISASTMSRVDSVSMSWPPPTA